MTDEGVAALVLELPGGSLVALAAQIRSIDCAPGPEAQGPDAAGDLDDRLGDTTLCDCDVAPHWLRLEAEPALALRTRAHLRLERIAPERFFRLPRVLHRAGCASWVRGVVVGPPAAPRPDGSPDDSPAAEGELAVWIDLSALASSPSSNSGSNPCQP